MEYRNEFEERRAQEEAGAFAGGPVYSQEVEPPRKSSAFAVVSLVFGIVGLVFGCCFFWLSMILGIVGLVLGIISLVQNRDGKGMAIAGAILSGIALLLSILIFIFYLTFGIGMTGIQTELTDEFYYEEDLEEPECFPEPEEGPARL